MPLSRFQRLQSAPLYEHTSLVFQQQKLDFWVTCSFSCYKIGSEEHCCMSVVIFVSHSPQSGIAW